MPATPLALLALATAVHDAGGPDRARAHWSRADEVLAKTEITDTASVRAQLARLDQVMGQDGPSA
ncbi:hypothetical protein [Kutzneria sp. CA-103260]|uniref:hypothetical protein n=1 Tax=Kutzneria sp. CA-103260 TaxID=2802641 RepID=UPI001BA513DE|nr:hypothetical protein [Kutzneria sp. CA-103260]QUQ66153.1 hypothetical protein JJ691_38790 [Kutzneria sp. CA-103260]